MCFGVFLMAQLFVKGGYRLCGSVDIHGAKNSALPILAACFLADGKTTLHNVPMLSDVDATLEILKTLGCRVLRSGHDVEIDSTSAECCEIPFRLMQKMRSSIIFLGAVLGKCGRVKMCLPGGCELGPRPIDLHLASLRLLGAKISDCRGELHCSCDRLCGHEIDLPFPSVGATENILLSAVTAKGVTTVHNAAREPEIMDLAEFLVKCGAKISGAGGSVITITGVDRLGSAEHTIIPDRIEAATYMAAAGITGGELTLRKVIPSHIQPVLFAFREAGCSFDIRDDSLKIFAPPRPSSVKSVRTLVYPGFPTDALLPFMAMQTLARGSSMFIETIFQNRYKQVDDLCRMGATIKTEGRVAVIDGVDALYGTNVFAEDLRGGAALIVAGLAAHDVTKIGGVHHIDRGYEDIEGTLCSLGAEVWRE